MADAFISSDPNAWLRPYWQRLHQQQSFFANLAPELQASALAEAAAEDHPNKAAEIREWNATTRWAMIAVLDQALREKHADKQTELWRMIKGQRTVTCMAVDTLVGLGLRLFDRGEMLRTELCGDEPILRARAERWKRQLEQGGRAETVIRQSPFPLTSMAGTLQVGLDAFCPDHHVDPSTALHEWSTLR